MKSNAKKQALYARRATGQIKDLEEQFNIIRKTMSADVEEAQIERYCDIASGLAGFEPGVKQGFRPGLCKLAQDIRAGRIECVHVAEADRLARSPLVLGRFQELCCKHGVPILVGGKQLSPITECAVILAAAAIRAANGNREGLGA